MAISLGPADGDDDDEVMSSINTTPLVDVMLVLLIILLITIPLQTHSVNLDMPNGPPPVAAPLPEVVRIDINAEGAVTWNGQTVADHAELDSRLHAAAIAQPAPEVHIRPDRAVAYGPVASVLAAAQLQGITKLGIVGAEQFLP
ncbi:MAG: biopolymer transporter ExbD [Magnetospirillum sp.]|nr:biopolymer transporter ExbD [Magnetospirillum sp.]